MIDMVDCSRIGVENYKFTFIEEIKDRLQKQEKAGQYRGSEDKVYIHSNFVRKYNECPNIIGKVMSHEFLHMILYHLEGKETCNGLDKFLKKTKKYSLGLIGNGGI